MRGFLAIQPEEERENERDKMAKIFLSSYHTLQDLKISYNLSEREVSEHIQGCNRALQDVPGTWEEVDLVCFAN